MKYNMKNIMVSAWTIWRNTRSASISFSECLKRAWASAKNVVTKFENGMTVVVDGYTRTLSRWTKGGNDRVYINGGSHSGDGFVDLNKRVANLRGGLTYQNKIAEMVLAMEF